MSASTDDGPAPAPPGRDLTGVPRVIVRLTQAAHVWGGAIAMLLAGSCWALFCLLLARDGHMPSKTLIPLAREHYYDSQARFVLPLLVLLWLVCSLLSTRTARKLGGTGSFRSTANAMGVALAVPLLVLFLLPDLIVYQTVGFSGLKLLVRVTAPLSFAASLLLASFVVRAAHQLRRGRALLAAAAGVLAQALLGGVLLR